mmetsp:Transcript_24975/g.56541  ORF Transcript_24975/g.56541 Transcript_24975/m.56541 type:complete len:207 (-) Transcript_24975:669-1289(-)
MYPHCSNILSSKWFFSFQILKCSSVTTSPQCTSPKALPCKRAAPTTPCSAQTQVSVAAEVAVAAPGNGGTSGGGFFFSSSATLTLSLLSAGFCLDDVLGLACGEDAGGGCQDGAAGKGKRTGDCTGEGEDDGFAFPASGDPTALAGAFELEAGVAFCEAVSAFGAGAAFAFDGAFSGGALPAFAGACACCEAPAFAFSAGFVFGGF